MHGLLITLMVFAGIGLFFWTKLLLHMRWRLSEDEARFDRRRSEFKRIRKIIVHYRRIATPEVFENASGYEGSVETYVLFNDEGKIIAEISRLGVEKLEIIREGE